MMGMVPLFRLWLSWAPHPSYTGSEYSLLTHYQILTSFTGGEVSNSKGWLILLISEHIQDKGNICAIMEGIFKFRSRKKIIVFLMNKII